MAFLIQIVYMNLNLRCPLNPIFIYYHSYDRDKISEPHGHPSFIVSYVSAMIERRSSVSIDVMDVVNMLI